jgi:S1-C subfamily serine protease
MRKWFNKQTIITFLLGIFMIPVGAYAVPKMLSAGFTDNGLVINGQRITGQVAAVRAEGQQWASTYAPLQIVARALGGKAWIENNDVVIETYTSLEEVVKNCKDSCVMLYCYGSPDLPEGAASQGSGFVYNNGYVITAKHVVEGATRIDVFTDDSIYSIPGTVVPIDSDLDVVVLKADIDLPSVTLGDSDVLIEGEKIISITSPNGAENTIDECIYTGKAYDRKKYYLGISDTFMTGGSSGGAVFNYQGQIIGMASLGLEGLQEAIPINDIKPILQKLK